MAHSFFCVLRLRERENRESDLRRQAESIEKATLSVDREIELLQMQVHKQLFTLRYHFLCI
jgi:hypothetical protein